MTAQAQPNSKPSFIKVVKRGAKNTLTFFGVPANTILVVFAIILLLLNVYPLITLFVQSFQAQTGNSIPVLSEYWGKFTWDEIAYVNKGSGTAYYWWYTFASDAANGYFWTPLWRSLVVSVLACCFSILFGGVMAYLITRTNMPFKKFLSAVFIFPYIMPQWTLALFWKNFFISTACNAGYVGELQALTGWAAPEWMVYGIFPISMVLGLHYTPFAYILIGGVLQNMDSNLEEAATILNIPRWKRFTRVTVPMLMPALLSTILLVFSSAISSYSVPVTLGNPINCFLLATQMKQLLQSDVTIGTGYVEAIILIFFGVIMLILNQMQTASRKQFTTVTGKSGQVSKANLGKVNKWIIASIALILVIFNCFGPMISFFLESLLPNPGDFSSGLNFDAWVSPTAVAGNSAGYCGLFREAGVWKALGGSVLLSLCCSFLAGTCGLLIGYAVSRKRKSGLAAFVNNLAFFPYLMPSISLSLIFFLLATQMQIPNSSKGIFFVMVIVGMIKYIPFASRTALNAMLQLSNEIEEAAVIQHVPWIKRMARILFPIQKSAFISGYLLPFISCMREYDLFVFLGSDKFILTRYMFFFQETGVDALMNAANFVLIVIILIFNYAVNLITGASMDKGIGGK